MTGVVSRQWDVYEAAWGWCANDLVTFPRRFVTADVTPLYCHYMQLTSARRRLRVACVQTRVYFESPGTCLSSTH